MAVALGVSGIVGTWLGGKMADIYGKRDKRHILTLPAIGMAVAAPILFAGYYAEDWRIAVALLIVPTMLNAAYYGPAYGCVQGLVRPEARAISRFGHGHHIWRGSRAPELASGRRRTGARNHRRAASFRTG